jgi:hypothetical protein
MRSAQPGHQRRGVLGQGGDLCHDRRVVGGELGAVAGRPAASEVLEQQAGWSCGRRIRKVQARSAAPPGSPRAPPRAVREPSKGPIGWRWSAPTRWTTARRGNGSRVRASQRRRRGVPGATVVARLLRLDRPQLEDLGLEQRRRLLPGDLGGLAHQAAIGDGEDPGRSRSAAGRRSVALPTYRVRRRARRGSGRRRRSAGRPRPGRAPEGPVGAGARQLDSRSSTVVAPRLPARSSSPCSTSTVARASASARCSGACGRAGGGRGWRAGGRGPRRAAAGATAGRCRPRPARAEGARDGRRRPAGSEVEAALCATNTAPSRKPRTWPRTAAIVGASRDHRVGDAGDRGDRRAGSGVPGARRSAARRGPRRRGP